MVDMNNRKLVDTCTHLSIQGIRSSSTSTHTSLCPKDNSNPYHKLLAEFPALTQATTPNTPVLHVTHHIETILDPSVSAHPRRLAPDLLRVAKREFEHMLQLGIIRPSSRAWSSPLHMVPKKHLVTGDPVVTTMLSTATPFLTGIPYHTLTIFLSPYRVPPFSQNWT